MTSTHLALAFAALCLALTGCGDPVAGVFRTLTPPQPELTTFSPTASFVLEVELSAAAPAPGDEDDDVQGFISLDLCSEPGPAGLPCQLDRVEAPAPFEEPDVKVSLVRLDNALLPFASVDTEGTGLYEGRAELLSDELWDADGDRLRRYSVRFDRSDTLRQSAGTAPGVHHVVWSVSASAYFPGLLDEEVSDSWLSLRLVDAN